MHKARYFELVFYKTYADLRAEAARTYISFLWWILDPLINMVVFYFVFIVLHYSFCTTL
jgi:lipopolysaccharide transport system permease protein